MGIACPSYTSNELMINAMTNYNAPASSLLIGDSVSESPQTDSLLPLSKQRVKKDALWKPLLRGFRIYIRRTLRIFMEINQIYDGTGDLSEKAQEACRKYIRSIGAPEEV